MNITTPDEDQQIHAQSLIYTHINAQDIHMHARTFISRGLTDLEIKEITASGSVDRHVFCH